MEAAPIPGGVTAVATVPVPAVPTIVLLLFPRPQDCGSHPTGGGSAPHLTGCAAESCPAPPTPLTAPGWVPGLWDLFLGKGMLR